MKKENRKHQIRRGTIMMILGAMMVLGALSLLLYNRHKEMEVGDTSEKVVSQLSDLILKNAAQTHEANDGDDDIAYNLETEKSAVEETVAESGQPDITSDEASETLETTETEPEATKSDMDFVNLDGYTYIGVLDMPTLGLSLPIQWGWSDALLDISPCRYWGTQDENNLIILAHNYATHFGTIKYLQVGDIVTFTDIHGVITYYQVVGSESFNRSLINQIYVGDWDLTLFTCVPNTYNRLAVRCKRVTV